MTTAEIGTVLENIKDITIVARADAAGSAIEVLGDGDGEAVCAIAALCAPPMERAAEMLGLADISGWSISTKSKVLYVRKTDAAFVAAVGKQSQRPEQILAKLITETGGES